MADLHVPCFCFGRVGVCTSCLRESFSMSAVSYQQRVLTHAAVTALSWPLCNLPTAPALPWRAPRPLSCWEAIFRSVVTADLGSQVENWAYFCLGRDCISITAFLGSPQENRFLLPFNFLGLFWGQGKGDESKGKGLCCYFLRSTRRNLPEPLT